MLQYERSELLLELLNKKKTASVRELASALYVSEASVRRDIERLEARGLVRKIYGGVTVAERGGTLPVSFRDSDHGAVKTGLARRAAELVNDGDTVILDASSTVRRMLKFLFARRDLTIITNNARIFADAAEYPLSEHGIRLYAVGGIFLYDDHAFAGPAAESFISKINADIMFFSSQGVSEEGEISDASEEQTSLRRMMLTRAKRKYFLCDSSKIGVERLFRLCRCPELDGVICDVPLPWEP